MAAMPVCEIPAFDSSQFFCKQLRENGYGGLILMLTAKSQEMDKVIGLESGADDYVTKPFGLRELTARVHALLRRSRPAKEQAEESLTAGDLMLDLKTFELKRGDVSVSLSAREVKLLQFFLNHPGEVLSRDRILNEVWGYEYYANTRVLDQSVVQLRKKFASIGANPKQNRYGTHGRISIASRLMACSLPGLFQQRSD
jgi:DNA-binding response OmpR family regulator